MWEFFMATIRSFYRVLHKIYSVFLGFFQKQKLEDIIVQKGPKAVNNRRIEEMLRQFPNEYVNTLGWDTGDETEAAEAILEESISDEQKRHDLSKALARSMRQIKGYQKLCMEVEERRLETYNSRIVEHERELLRLWNLLMPDEPLIGRRTDQWQEIGFQGEDPATDFRGMGMLGLDQLVFFAQYDVDNCRRVMTISRHPIIGFPFAICGITITALCKELLFDDLLKNHFYNAMEQPPIKMDHFHQVYCRVFTLFADYWEWERPQSVMEFNFVKQRFFELLENYLTLPDANLNNANLMDLRPVHVTPNAEENF